MFNNEVINEILYDFGRIIVPAIIAIILFIAYNIFRRNKIGFLTICFALSAHYADLIIRFCIAVKPGMVGITGIPAVRFLVLHDDIHPEQYFWALLWGIGTYSVITSIGIITFIKADFASSKLDTALYKITIPAVLGGPFLLYSYINTMRPDYEIAPLPVTPLLSILWVVCYFILMLFIGYIVTIVLFSIRSKKRDSQL